MNPNLDKAKDRGKRAQTVRSVVATGALALFMGLWGVIYTHQTPAGATAADALAAVPGSAQSGTVKAASVQTSSQAAAKPAAQVHTRTRAS